MPTSAPPWRAPPIYDPQADPRSPDGGSASASTAPPARSASACLQGALAAVCDHEPVASRGVEWAVAGALAGWAGARLAGADRLRFAEAWTVPLLSFTPQVT